MNKPHPLPFAVWLARANAALLARAAIVFIADSHSGHWGDSGADESDLRRYHADGDSPERAAEYWAEKYDLSAEPMESDFARAAAAYLAKAEPAARLESGYSPLEAEAALCAWEALCEWRDTYAKAHFPPAGSVAMRHGALHLAPWILAVYDRLDRDALDVYSYDWEIVPAILRHALEATTGADWIDSSPPAPDVAETAAKVQAAFAEADARRAHAAAHPS